MVPLLLACDAPAAMSADAPDTGSAVADSVDETGAPDDTGADTGVDTGDDAETGDTADTSGDIPAGPECDVDHGWDVATPFNVLAGHVVLGTASEAELIDLRTVIDRLIAEANGPWSHGVRGPYTSTDSVAFSGSGDVVLYAASVPDVAVRPDGTLVMFFVNGDLDAMLAAAEAHAPMRSGLIGIGGLGAATSADGVTWTPMELTFDAPLPTYAVDPELHALPGGGWALYFLGVPAEELCANGADPFLVPGVHRLYRAVSDDLQSWSGVTEVWQNPEGGVDPAVWCVDDATCYGWFSAGMVSEDGGATFAGTSAISVPWIPQVPEVTRLADGSWRMYALVGGQLEAATSDDGLLWTSTGATGILAGSPSVVVGDGDALRMWTSALAE